MIGQVFQITLLSLRNLPSRLGSSSVIVVGIGGVVGVLVAILAMAKGFEASMSRAGQPDRAIVMRGGSTSELSSGMGPGEIAVVGSWSEVTAASGELYLVADVPKRSNQSLANLAIRGVEQDAFEIRPEISIVEGRSFVTGRTEMIAGRGAVAEFEGVETGSTIELRNSTWTIVGMFEADGSVYESEVWADLATAQSIFRREGGVSSMRVRLASPDAADVLSQRMEDDPRLDLTLTGEDEYFKSQSQQLTTLIETFGYGVAAIMAVGAIFAALNTMYTAVSARTVEIATLRALGFGGMPVVASVVIEALLLALLGGAVGAAVAYFGFNGWTVSTLGGSFSQVAFDFAVTPELLVFGIVWAVGLGLVGGMFPAVRAARLPITTALRGE
ncbi:MAG: FtsX-like permease family protein [Gammaproteobacteria bacterium]|nr:FtsX-like permease family protein [Gammaproteobacteria bacterium]